MKVGIIGNYGNENNGDEAILSGIVTQLTRRLAIDLSDITVFSNHPENTLERHRVQVAPLIYRKGKLSIPLTILKSYQTMRAIDLLIIGGGGLLMDLYKRDAPLYSTLAYIGKKAKCKIIVYGVGAGPLNTRLGKFFIRRLLKIASHIAVRDEKSQALLHSLQTGKEIHLTIDPAFALKAEQRRKPSEKVTRIGVTAVPYFNGSYWPTEDKDRYRQYIEGMARNLDRLVEGQPLELTFFSTKFPEDVEASKQIRMKMKHQDKAKVIDARLTPEELLGLSAQQDLVIGTRLHSIILSIVTETPVLGVAYHHKVNDFMSAQNLKHRVIPVTSLHESDHLMADIYEDIQQNWHQEQVVFQHLSNQLHEEASQGFMNLIGKAINE
ncbi:polysaccharide pyruvyl transferase CsaB [Pullulanibacillus pueri]|uniref:Polysaccharide pyruvyl transferase CsaB n=1 Tax=Pullulanibacillus pueri TaxID=1437324 RepID=A0A8J3EKR0_9BACL|nr:polysaccharide pyruvyl transferase family protein [Pullulanibacillus pueri]MBM7681888.1 polysaccharide pyruvyl transferase CsaB [Pullulanibacillus pueri]GGH76476.1 polysaccharide pyruvyl transferase CsaB [Pullulanibacillus pueri]